MKAIPNPLEEGWHTLADIGRLIGNEGMRKWLKNVSTNSKDLQRIGHCCYVSPDLVERYLEAVAPVGPNVAPVAKRPKGWLGSMQVAEILGCSRETALKLSNSGKLVSAQASGTRYYDPESVERLRLEREKPLHGYVMLRRVGKAHNFDHMRIKVWLEANGFAVKRFAEGGIRKTLWATEEAVAAWLEYRAQYKRNMERRSAPCPRRVVPHQRIWTAQHIKELQDRRARGDRVTDLAREYRISVRIGDEIIPC